jgi:hypothetical protein
MLTIMAAAAMVLPHAEQDFNREVEREVPRAVLKTNVAGIWYQAFVDADGRITQCSVRGTLGESDAAELACNTLIGRQISPATVDGKAVYGVYQGVMVLSDNDFNTDIVFEPDVLLEVENLPSNRPVRAELIVMVDAAGRVSECKARNWESPYTKVACDQAKELQLPVGKSEAGDAVAYVYPLTYEFTENLASR